MPVPSGRRKAKRRNKTPDFHIGVKLDSRRRPLESTGLYKRTIDKTKDLTQYTTDSRFNTQNRRSEVRRIGFKDRRETRNAIARNLTPALQKGAERRKKSSGRRATDK